MSRLAILAITIAALVAPDFARAQLQTQGRTLGAPAKTVAFSTLTGTVTAINFRARTFTCLWRSKIRYFSLAPDARFRIGGAAADFRALRLGDRVTVRFQTTARDLIAQNIDIDASRAKPPRKARSYGPAY